MKLSIRQAGFDTGVHRSTLHHWLKSGRLKKDSQGRVDTDDIIRLKSEQKTGRPGGLAYPNHVRSDLRNIGVTLDRALYHIAAAVRSLPEERRSWVCETVLAKFANEKALAAFLHENLSPVDDGDKDSKKIPSKLTPPQGLFEDLLQSSKSRNPHPYKGKLKTLNKVLVEPKRTR